MSFSQIESELENLTADELRRLAMKSWDAFIRREGRESVLECDEDDPSLLAALDRALALADANPRAGLTGDEARARLSQWTNSK